MLNYRYVRRVTMLCSCLALVACATPDASKSVAAGKPDISEKVFSTGSNLPRRDGSLANNVYVADPASTKDGLSNNPSRAPAGGK